MSKEAARVRSVVQKLGKDDKLTRTEQHAVNNLIAYADALEQINEGLKVSEKSARMQAEGYRAKFSGFLKGAGSDGVEDILNWSADKCYEFGRLTAKVLAALAKGK